MYIQEIQLKSIIERKINYIETSEVYMDDELVNVKIGELKAYNIILEDMNGLDEFEFIKKYEKILYSTQKKFEQPYFNKLDKNETEELTGYNNAIVFVLSLLNPQYEFCD